MQDKENITIGVTAYREGHLLKKCIDGILAQTLEDWKGIIVLDGGHDDITKNIVETLDDPRFIKIILDVNIGPYPAREMIFAKSDSDVILHCDGDDILRPGAAEAVKKMFSDDAIAYAGFSAELQFPDGTKSLVPGHKTTFKKFILDNDFPGYIIFRKSIWEKYGRYHKKLYKGRADFEFILKLIYYNEPFKYDEEIIIDKTERAGSISRSYNLDFVEKHEVIVESNPDCFSDIQLKNKFLKNTYLHGIWAAYKAGDMKRTKEMVDKFSSYGTPFDVFPLNLIDIIPVSILNLLVRFRITLSRIKHSRN